MKKVILSILAMLLPMLASAASTTFLVNDILYEMSNKSGEVSVSKSSFELAGEVVIPETVEYEGETYSVTSIDNNAFENRTGLTSITLPSSVRIIWANAFRGCTNLSTVNLAYGLKTIETGAFRDCTALTSIIIPKRMRSISKEAFAGCTGLTSIYSEEYTPFPIGDAFSPETYSNATLSVPYYTKRLYQTMKGWDQFSKIDERDAIKSATIHVAVAGTLHDYISDDEKYNIEELSLSGELNGADFCLLREMTGNDTDGYETEGRLRVLDLSQTKLVASDVKFMESTYCVWDYRVSASTGISNKTINDPSEFPGYSFCGCISLISITFPKDITAIGDYAFEGCGILAEINVPDGVSAIGTRAFGFFSDFYPTPYWMEVHPDGLMYTGKVLYAYKGEMAPNTTIVLEEGTTGIAGSAFTYNSSHKGDNMTPSSVIIPRSMTSIGIEAFSHCTGLTSITIPDNVKSIGSRAFSGCSGLTSITIPYSVIEIGIGICNDCSALTSIVVESENPNYDSRENCNAIIETNSNTLIASCMNTIIPESVTIIGESAFNSCRGLTSIYIPNDVTSVDKYAFRFCNELTSVAIGNKLSSIGAFAFANCTQLTDITCRSTTIPETSSDAFNYSNVENATLHVPASALKAYQETSPWSSFGSIVALDEEDMIKVNPTSANECEVVRMEGYSGDVVIPESIIVDGKEYTVTAIGEKAFFSSDVTSVTIPNTVTTIGDNAFNGARSLTSINIPNSVTSIGRKAFYRCKEMTTATLGNSVTTIGDWAFSECSSLTSIEIPSTVTSIGNATFSETDLTTVISLIENPFEIGGKTSYKAGGNEYYGAFSKKTFNNATLYVPKGTIDKYKATGGWKDFVNIKEGTGGTDGLCPIVSVKENAGVYSLKGNKLKNPQQGINIIKMEDGTTKKMYVK